MTKKRLNLDISKAIWIEIGVLAAREDVSKTEMLNRLLIESLKQKGVKIDETK